MKKRMLNKSIGRAKAKKEAETKKLKDEEDAAVAAAATKALEEQSKRS